MTSKPMARTISKPPKDKRQLDLEHLLKHISTEGRRPITYTKT